MIIVDGIDSETELHLKQILTGNAIGQKVTKHNPTPSPSGHPLLSGPPTVTEIHQTFTPANITYPSYAHKEMIGLLPAVSANTI